MKKYKFESHNDWCSFSAGKTEIVINSDGSVSHVTSRGKSRVGASASKWIDAHEKIKSQFSEWLRQRDEAISAWRHETPHFRFDCDGGSLAVRVNECVVVKIGCGGDGNHPVYVVRGVIPPFFKSTGVSLDACTIEPLDYDCQGGKPLTRLSVSSAWFYRHESAVAIVVD